MKAGLTRFESDNLMRVVKVDMDKKQSSTFQQYIKYFTGRSIPLTVVLDASGNPVHKMVGGRSYDQLVSETARFRK